MYNFVCESERKYENTPIYNGCIAGSTLATRDVHAYVFYDIKPLRVTCRLTDILHVTDTGIYTKLWCAYSMRKNAKDGGYYTNSTVFLHNYITHKKCIIFHFRYWKIFLIFQCILAQIIPFHSDSRSYAHSSGERWPK